MKEQFKVVEGKLVNNSFTYRIANHLAVTKTIVVNGAVPLTIELKPGDRIITEFVNKNRRRVWIEVKYAGKAAYMQLKFNEDNNVVVAEGPEVHALEGQIMAILEWIEPHQPKTNPELPAYRGGHHHGAAISDLHSKFPRVEIKQPLLAGKPYEMEMIGDAGETYIVVYDDYDKGMELMRVDDGLWSMAVNDHIDKIGLKDPGEKAVIGRVIFDDNSIGAIIDFPGHGEPHFYILNKALTCLRACPPPEGRYDITAKITVVFKSAPIKRELPDRSSSESEVRHGGHAEPQARVPMCWIPQNGQFVTLKDDAKKTLYVIHDYDQYENKFLLEVADSCRRKRALQFGNSENNKVSLIPVDPSQMRPLVLTV